MNNFCAAIAAWLDASSEAEMVFVGIGLLRENNNSL